MDPRPGPFAHYYSDRPDLTGRAGAFRRAKPGWYRARWPQAIGKVRIRKCAGTIPIRAHRPKRLYKMARLIAAVVSRPFRAKSMHSIDFWCKAGDLVPMVHRFVEFVRRTNEQVQCNGMGMWKGGW